MLLRATGLAILASLSPTALLIVAVYLGSARPKLTTTLYLTGAVVISVIMGVVALLLLRSADLSLPAEHTPRYAFRLGLGIVLVAIGVVVRKRKAHALPGNDGSAPQGIVVRMAGNPSPAAAFLVGVLVFAPGASFLAAVQVIATARAGVQLTALAMLIVVVLTVLLVWLPLLFYLAAPDATSRYLTVFNGWLRAHGRALLAGVLLTVGAIMVGNGIYGLVA
jgi:hypothetical protein